MAYPQHLIQQRFGRSMLYPIVALWGLAAVLIVTVLGSDAGFGDSYSKYYLVPWCVATGVVIAAPSVYLFYKGQFNPFHPLVFPAWSYFFPGFVIGGLFLATGLSQPYFLILVPDEHYNYPLTFIYIMVGYGGLALGFAIPQAKRIGSAIARRLPALQLTTEQVGVPGLMLLGLGLATTALAFIQGILGFQKVDEIGTFDGILFLLSLFWLESTFLLWLYVFRCKSLGVFQYFVIGMVLLTSLTKSAFQGNRGSLIQVLIVVVFAYVFSGRRLAVKHYVGGTGLLVIALVVGMIYGTTFRSVKESQQKTDIESYTNMVFGAFDRLGSQDVGTTLYVGLSTMAERLDSVSSLAVVVSNYEALAPYEELWGINDNIYADTVTFLIPRFIWPDKPVAIEPTKYADLYFNFPENSFAMTPMGDLLRNFGPFGVPIGMILLGFILRMVYASLIEDQEFSYWRITVYFMLLTTLSYEGVYGLIVPYGFKIGVTAVVGMLLIKVIATALSARTGAGIAIGRR
jgi:hypothetical protein